MGESIDDLMRIAIKNNRETIGDVILRDVDKL